MPRRRKTHVVRIAVPAAELERLIMAPLRERKTCTGLYGVGLVYVGSCGTEPNWFARTMEGHSIRGPDGYLLQHCRSIRFREARLSEVVRPPRRVASPVPAMASNANFGD